MDGKGGKEIEREREARHSEVGQVVQEEWKAEARSRQNEFRACLRTRVHFPRAYMRRCVCARETSANASFR